MSQRAMNRGFVVIGAVLIQVALGAIYAWSVFTPYLTPQLPKKDKKTGEYKQIVVFRDVDGVRVGKVIPKKPIADEDQKIIQVEALVSADGDAPDGYPFRQPKLVTATVEVAVDEKDDESSDPLKPSAADVSAAKARWTKTQTQVVFAAALATFALVMVIAGRKLTSWGSRKLAISGGVLLGLGYILAGVFGAANFWVTFVFVGLLGGAGIGLTYVVPIAVGMRWFPDKKGLITGLAVAGFGFGALLWIMLAGTWGRLLANLGLDMTFICYGVAFLVAVVVGALWMVFPPEGWKPEGWTPPKTEDTARSVASQVDLTADQMLRTPQFYMIVLTFLIGASAGLMSIGLMKLFPLEALTGAGMRQLAAVGVAEMAMGVFFSLANGIGRIAWGSISDHLGRKTSIVIMMATQGLLVIAFQWMAANWLLLYVGATLIGFNFGGNFALFPLITADTFGTKNVGQNYGWVFLAYGIGGIAGPILGGRLGDMGNFPLAFSICGALCIVAAGVICTVKPPTIGAEEAVLAGQETAVA